MKEYIATVLGAGFVEFLPFLNFNSQPNLPAPAPIPRLQQRQPIIQLQKSAKAAKRHRI